MELAVSLVSTHWPHQILAEQRPIREEHAISRLDEPITVKQGVPTCKLHSNSGPKCRVPFFSTQWSYKSSHYPGIIHLYRCQETLNVLKYPYHFHQWKQRDYLFSLKAYLFFELLTGVELRKVLWEVFCCTKYIFGWRSTFIWPKEV